MRLQVSIDIPDNEYARLIQIAKLEAHANTKHFVLEFGQNNDWIITIPIKKLIKSP